MFLFCCYEIMLWKMRCCYATNSLGTRMKPRLFICYVFLEKYMKVHQIEMPKK